MPETKAPPAPSTKGYRMPVPEVGQVVYWYPHYGLTMGFLPAVVLAVGPENVTIHVMDSASITFRPADGVRHVADPNNARINTSSPKDYPGAWDFTPRDKKIEELLKGL